MLLDARRGEGMGVSGYVLHARKGGGMGGIWVCASMLAWPWAGVPEDPELPAPYAVSQQLSDLCLGVCPVELEHR